MAKVTLFENDCLKAIPMLEENSIDAVITDPPYGLKFMNKSWDYQIPNADLWREVLRVMKPGAHLLCFGGTRTSHRIACEIEDAGFEIRDCVMWLYGSGFPKSHDVSKALDRAAGVERQIIGTVKGKGGQNLNCLARVDGNDSLEARGCGAFGQGAKQNDIDIPVTAPATKAARQWQGWGTALKPAWEPIFVARKPLIGTVAVNVLAHGVGALNIDGCRIDRGSRAVGATDLGRWPANVTHDGSDEVMEAFARFGELRARGNTSPTKRRQSSGVWAHNGSAFGVGEDGPSDPGDTGTAARFFYCAKASAKDRAGSKHPTVKPIALMRYLCRLVTQPDGTILDPFAGSGTTGQAAIEEGFNAILIEKEAQYCEDIRNRLGIR